MARNDDDQNTVRQYLLRQLSDDEERVIEQRLLSEDALFEELEIGEDELIDEYLAEELSADERKTFQRNFLGAPERKQKLKFAQALNRQISTAPLRADTVEPGWFFRFTRWLRQSFFTSHLLVAASILIVVGLGFAVWRGFFYHSDVDKGLIALNAAYSQQRPVEARITRFDYAPYTTTRGSEPERVDALERERAERYLLDAVRDHPGVVSYHALGKFYLANREFDKAIAQFEEAIKADPKTAQTYADLGAALLERGKIEVEAAAASQPSPNEGNANSGKGLADLALSLEKLNKALELDPNLLEARFNRALCYQYMMLPRQAAEEWREYLKKDSISKWADEARRNLKLLEQQANQPILTKEELLKNFLLAQGNKNNEEAWRIASTSRDDLAGTNIGQQLLRGYLDFRTAGKREEADQYQRSLSYLGELESERGGERYTLDIANNCLGLTSGQANAASQAWEQMESGYSGYRNSQLPDAMEAFRTAAQKFSEAGDYSEKALAEYWVAYCSLETGNVAYSLAVLPRLIDYCRERDYRWLLMRALYSMASVEFSINEPSKGIEYCNNALKVGNEIGDLIGVFNVLDALTEFYRSVNNYSASIDTVGKSQPLLTQCALNPIKVWRHHAIVASAFNSARYYAAAVAYQREATKRAVDVGELSMVCLSYSHLGLMLGKQGDYEEGLDNAWLAFNTAAGRPADAVSPKMMAYSALQIAHLYHEKGECDKAAENYEKSIALFQNLDFPTAIYQAHKGLFMCQAMRGDDAKAQQELATTLTALEKYRSTIVEGDNRNKFFDNEQSVYDLAIDFAAAKLKNPEQAFNYSEASRARSLFDLLKASPKVQGTNLTADSTPAKVFSPLTYEGIKDQIPAETHILQYAVLQDKLVIWVVNNRKLTMTEKSISEDVLNQRITKFLDSLSQRGDAPNTTLLGRELFDDLIGPVQNLLDVHKQLCIIPDKALNTIPFGALVSTSSGKYLIEDYCISYAPSSSVFIQASNHAKSLEMDHSEKLLSVGNPSFDRGSYPALAELPEAATEARSISAYYPAADVLIGPNARKRAIVAAMANAQVIHLALHAINNSGDELHSRLVLAKDQGESASDECLEAHELYRLKLPRARLLILSACRSGVGDYYQGEGTLSLARPFLAAEVPMVVASLWPVDSKATEELMVNFHRLRTPGLPSAEALRRAQVALIRSDNEQLRQPYSWAAFFVTGGYAQF